LLAIAGFATLMSVYFFVDQLPLWAESLVLSQRLILPVVAFLLIGYVELLAGFAERFRRGATWGPTVALLLASLLMAIISYRHRRWQRPAEGVLEAASEAASSADTAELALTYEASKIGILYRGPLRRFLPGASRAKVVLCAESSPSYRLADVNAGCAFPGYRLARVVNGFHILIREANQNAAPGAP